MTPAPARPVPWLDHRRIGLAYALTAGLFLLLGFGLVLLLRWQLAAPGEPIPGAAALLGAERMPGGVMSPEFYNQLGAMHGTIMVFLGVVPLAVGGFGNVLIPLQIGASEMAFPRLNLASWLAYAAAGMVMVASFFAPGGAAQSGWTSYPPLADVAPTGQTLWLCGMTLLLASSTLGSVNTIVTVVQLRAPGLTWRRLPFLPWTQLVTAVLLLLAFPPLGAAAAFQLMDRLAGTSFFLPSGLVVSGEALAVAGGGSALLWQHLFWFLAHPEVYVLVLPALGIVAEVIAANTRKPLWGYRAMVGSTLGLGLVSFLVWAHHMFLTGMGTAMSAFFQATTMIVSVPSVVILGALVASLWGGRIRFTPPMLFALAFLPLFGLGGLTGLPLGLAASDVHLHDTYYVIGHFHLMVAPGVLFGLFAGIYHWYPKVTGRLLDERLARLHFWTSLPAMAGVFVPMLVQGLGGLNRRLWDGGISYAHARDAAGLHAPITWAAFALALAQIPFLVNLALSLRRGRPAGDNPWRATTLEWAGSSRGPIAAHGDPYDYGPAAGDRGADFRPQWQARA